MLTYPVAQDIEMWPIDRLVEYPRNPRKNDAAVDRMCESIREFGFKVPCLVRGDGEVVDGHLRLKAARKLGITEIPVILCDEWTPAQVKAFRLMVNRSVTWADWDETALALELQEIQEADFDLSLTGFDPGEIDGLLALEDDEIANAAPPLSDSPVSRLGDLWRQEPVRVKRRKGLELARVSSPKSSLGSDGDADCGRCCRRSGRSLDFDRKSFPDAPPQCCMAAWSRKMLCVRQSSAHSPFTFSLPRSKNWRNPRACLICPNTGSTTHLRPA